MNDVLTGPQETAEQRADLAELSGLLGIPTTENVNWALVRTLYRAQGWAACALAVADVVLAESFFIAMKDLPTSI